MTYNTIGDVLLAQSNFPEAMTSYREGFAIMQRLAGAQPDNRGWQRDLSFSYNKLGKVLEATGRLDDALQNYRDSAAITERLVSEDHGNAQWQSDLQFTASRIAGLGYKFVFAREFAKALEAVEQALTLAPDTVWFNLVRADALMFLGHADEARAVYLQYRGRKDVLGEKSWDAVVLQNFTDLRKAGLSDPLMDQIEREFSSAG